MDTARDQYRADALVDLVASVGGAAERRLGVVDADLFVPELNFVFGLARDDVAVISIARLHDPRRLVERAVKEAVHELGHTYGLHHCRDPRCVMRFSNTLAETDRKAADLCAEDRDRLDVVLSLARSA